MNISNDNPSVDPIEYITKQLPKDLVQLLQVRDELAKRQGDRKSTRLNSSHT